MQNVGTVGVVPGEVNKLSVWRRLLMVNAEVVDALAREMQEALNLPLTWYEVLLYLHESPAGRIRMSELAETLLLSRSVVTRFIDRMERAGLVSREPCTTDGRGTFVVMTEAGRARFDGAAPLHLEGIRRRFLVHLSNEEAERMASVFDRVLAASKSAESGG